MLIRMRIRDWFLLPIIFINLLLSTAVSYCFAQDNKASVAEESIESLRKRAELGDVKAQSKLGSAYTSGTGIARDYVEAARWYRKAAEQGDAEAQIGIAGAYLNGRGVILDYAEGARWLERAAEQGEPAAQLVLAATYAGGRGVPQDTARAVTWSLIAVSRIPEQDKFRKEAEDMVRPIISRATPELLESAGRLVKVWRPNGLPLSLLLSSPNTESLTSLRQQAEGGDANAQTNLGFIYQIGKGVAQDYAEADRWFAKAADQGNATAQFALAIAYSDGRGVAHDDSEAVRWLGRAAEQGHPTAQLYLALSYYAGKGVAQDSVKALMWGFLAAARCAGEEKKKADNFIQSIGIQVTEEQLAQVRRLVEAWRPKHGSKP